MTVKQAAEWLAISRSSVYKLIEEGRLPYQRIGRWGKRGKITATEEDI